MRRTHFVITRTRFVFIGAALACAALVTAIGPSIVSAQSAEPIRSNGGMVSSQQWIACQFFTSIVIECFG